MQSVSRQGLRVRGFVASFLLMLGAVSLRAQTFRGGLNGTIIDQSGAVVWAPQSPR